MSKTETIRVHGDGDWEVWIGLGEPLPVLRQRNSFIIGTGETREAAVADAIKDLEAILAELRGNA